MLAFSTQGVTHAVPGRSSSITVAPEGWLLTGISTDVGARPGRGAISSFGVSCLTTGSRTVGADSTGVWGAGAVSVGLARGSAGLDGSCLVASMIGEAGAPGRLMDK